MLPRSDTAGMLTGCVVSKGVDDAPPPPLPPPPQQQQQQQKPRAPRRSGAMKR
jgi:hypothetical protein